MSIFFYRAKLLCWKSRDLGWRTCWDWWADGVFLHLSGRNVADAPSRYLWGAPTSRQWSHWLTRHIQTDRGAGDGGRERESVLAQAGCYPVKLSVPGTGSPDRQEGMQSTMQVSVPRVNTTCAGITANADLFSQPHHPLTSWPRSATHWQAACTNKMFHYYTWYTCCSEIRGQ